MPFYMMGQWQAGGNSIRAGAIFNKRVAIILSFIAFREGANFLKTSNETH